MYKDMKFFFSPEGGGSNTPSGNSLPDVEMPPSISDRDILNQDDSDADANEQVPSGKGKGKKQEAFSEKEGKETDSSDDEGPDGTEDESVEDDEEDEDDNIDDDEEDGDGEEPEDDEVDFADLTRAVKKAAPELFKKIPGLRDALEGYKEYTEVFPNVEEAKTAQKNAGFLFAMYNDIASGDVDRTANFFKAIKNTNEDAFEDFSHTVLDSIGKLDPQLYGQIMLKPMKKAIMAMYADALRTQNKNLAAVAIHAHNYWFDTQDIKAPLEERKKATKTKEQEEWEKEKQSYDNTRLEDFRSGITEVVNHSMKLSITKELDGIKLDDYQKRNIIRDIFSEIDSVLGSDKRYLSGIQSLFDQAKSAKYSPDWKTRIVKAYLQRARQALPGIRNKVLREAGIKVKEQPKSESRRLVPAGLGGDKREDGIDFSRVDRSRTTDMDILNGKPKYLK